MLTSTGFTLDQKTVTRSWNFDQKSLLLANPLPFCPSRPPERMTPGVPRFQHCNYASMNQKQEVCEPWESITSSSIGYCICLCFECVKKNPSASSPRRADTQIRYESPTSSKPGYSACITWPITSNKHSIKRYTA